MGIALCGVVGLELNCQIWCGESFEVKQEKKLLPRLHASRHGWLERPYPNPTNAARPRPNPKFPRNPHLHPSDFYGAISTFKLAHVAVYVNLQLTYIGCTYKSEGMVEPSLAPV
jgi:hypothetical protein